MSARTDHPADRGGTRGAGDTTSQVGAPSASRDERSPRVAAVTDAGEIARLLHDFNAEFDTPSPSVDVLAARLEELLVGEATFAIVAGTPAVGVAVITLRPNVWCAGPVALLDELYVVPQLRSQGIGSLIVEEMMSICRARDVDLVEINVDESDVDAQRFYERHGFASTDPGSSERSFYYSQEIES